MGKPTLMGPSELACLNLRTWKMR